MEKRIHSRLGQNKDDFPLAWQEAYATEKVLAHRQESDAFEESDVS